jgi:hypothetical protein
VTAPANKIPVSVDYTGRDYYALREELIARVKEATNGKWQGNDPADFGLALVESFAYMGDLINYYIDRVSNESYLLTATQRQSLLNLASTYGYTPTGYVGAVVDAEFSNGIGSQNEIGGSILTTVTVDGTPTAHVASLAVPINHPFEVGDFVKVDGLQQTAYNGVYEVIKTGLDGANTVICYKPESTISTISGDGTKFTVTTTVPHQFAVGEAVVISGASVSGYNANWTVLAVPTDETFTVTSALTTAATGGKVNYQNIATNGDSTSVLGYAYTIGSTIVPAGTQLVAEVRYEDKVQQVMFTTLSDRAVGWLGNDFNPALVQCRQGEDVSFRPKNRKNLTANPHDINGELLGYSAGTADQAFSLLETVVDVSLLEVYVDSGTNFNKWQRVQHIADFGPNAAVYTVAVNASNVVQVNFGDGVSGAIPPKDSAIKATYLVGGGPIGNIDAGKLTSIVASPNAESPEEETDIRTKFTVTNLLPANGGSDPEPNEVIRYNAPRTLSALNRAVTLEDFSNLALSVSGVGKAKAVAENKSSVTIYIAPSISDNVSNMTPGVLTTGLETADMAVLRQSVKDFLSDKKQIGTTVTVDYPTYIPVVLTVEYTPLPQYTVAQVNSYIKSALFSQFSYNYVDFADVITPEEVEYKLRQVEGVRNIKVTEFYRTGGSGRSSMIGNPNEIFVFLDSNLEINTAPTDATLVSLVVGSGGTFDQSFLSEITDYTGTITNGTTSVTITPTANDDVNSLITANNTVVASGGSFTLLTPVGTTTLVVSVTAGDGVTVRNYRAVFSRVS